MDQRQVKVMAESLMSMHGLRRDGWRFAWHSSRHKAGMCKFGPKIVSISRNFAAEQDSHVVRLIVLHEIAHALAGARAGHGSAWRRTCAAIGGDPSPRMTIVRSA